MKKAKSPVELLAEPIVAAPQPQQLSIEQAMMLAAQHQAQGNLQQAEHLLRQILQVQPSHAFALHLLGVIAHQAGKPELALELIEKAILHDGNVALFHANAGEMYRQLGKLDEAVRHGERAVALDANMASAHSNVPDLSRITWATGPQPRVRSHPHRRGHCG
jgi:tetratricopeptide (TPR) repeat protein